MKALFLNPPFRPHFSRSERSPQVSKSGTLYYPIWLAQAAAWVEAEGAEIDLVDAVAGEMSVADCVARVRKTGPELIVVETSTPSFADDARTLSALRVAAPEAVLVLVGPHVSALPAWSLEAAPAADAVVRGEYELTLGALYRVLASGGDWRALPGLSVRLGNGLRHNPDAPLLEDLDRIPLMADVYRRFLDPRHYFFAAAMNPGVMVTTGRGCPHHCMWCLFNQTLHGRRYRHRSPERVVAEFEAIIAAFPEAREIWIEDDTFTIDRRHVREVCRLIIERGLEFARAPFRWYCNARPPLDLKTMHMMKAAGCRLLVTGFESGEPEILRNMGKGFTVDKALAFMRDARQVGLLVHGCFVLGNPGETRETMARTLEYAKRLLPDSAQFYFIHPYPGTEYWTWAVKNGCLVETDYSRWLDQGGRHRCVIALPGLPAAEIEAFCDHAYKEYHFSPPYLRMKLNQLFHDPREGLRSLRSGLGFVSGLMKPRHD